MPGLAKSVVQISEGVEKIAEITFICLLIVNTAIIIPY